MRGFVLRYLGALAAGATRPRARAQIPFPLRALAERLATRHLVAAGFDTGHVADEQHVLRLAYRRAAQKPASATIRPRCAQRSRPDATWRRSAGLRSAR